MMKFRTPISIPKSDFNIGYHNSIFGIGSCFAEEMGSKLKSFKFNTLINPFGSLYNVNSIENALLRIYEAQHYQEEELFQYQGVVHSWDHHSDFSHISENQVLQNINSSIDQANQFLRQTDRVFITLGTSYYYILNSVELPVANCHKVPQKHFSKRLLSVTETLEALENCVRMLNDISSKKVEIVCTVSPVKHLRDGMIQNKRSKAIALEAIHQVVEKNENVHYFPSFEILEDDLREYRFYNEAMTHPNEQATRYIWECFQQTYFDKETSQTLEEIEKIQKQQNHKVRFETSQAHLEAREKLKAKIENFQNKHPHIKL